MSFAAFLRCTFCSLFFLTSACSSTDERVQVDSRKSSEHIDLKGFWEKDYGLSDDFNSKFNLFIFDVQRSVTAAYAGESRGINGNVGAGASREALIGLARLAEEITRLPRVEVVQGLDEVKVKRENNFTLSCDLFEDHIDDSSNNFGTERCGWSGDQLVFSLSISSSLQIVHRLTLGPDGQQLNITTTVISSEVSSPLTISNFYRRYTPAAQDFECLLTLTRGNVCSQFGSNL